MQLIECVPNFSEGQDQKTIKKIAKAIKKVDEVRLLDVDPGHGANRTVYTFVGPPDAVIQAVFDAATVAVKRIDMRKHAGTHPRMGVLDVCPLIPLSNISLDEVDAYAHALAQKLGRELSIPCYLYEFSAQNEKRKNLATIRKGEYEGWAEKITKPGWKPDYGPSSFNKKTGVSAIGARDFLIAYNVTLATKDVEIAKKIAARVRESGRIIVNDEGIRMRIPGACKSLKAIGWFIEEYGRTQVSMNLTNIHETNIHQAFEACKVVANEFGVEITGSELIGMAPLKVFLEAGKYYCLNIDKAPSERELVAIAIESLGLNDLRPFDPNEKIIEYKL